MRPIVALLYTGASLAALIAPPAAAAPQASAPQAPPVSRDPSPAVPAEVNEQGREQPRTDAAEPTGPTRQTPSTDTVESEEVVVTGIRASLAAGVGIKRASSQIVDAVVSEDIGKLPDTNVAESLARVSGVQVSRGIGEGSDVSIRGLRQNVTLLNGRVLVDASGRGGLGLDSLGTRSYGLLATVPSELISRLEVTKLPGADQIEGGLGGIINVVTRRPLDSSKTLVAGSADVFTNDRRGKAGYRASALFSTTFADDSFGVLVNGVYSNRPFREDSFTSFNGYVPLTAAFNTNPSGVAFNPGGVAGSRIDDFRFQRIDDDRERIGLNGALQWRPDDATDLYLEGLYTKNDVDRTRHWLSFATSGAGTAYNRVALSSNGNLVSGVINAPVQTNFEDFTSRGRILSTSLGGTYEKGPLKLFSEIAYTDAKQDIRQNFIRLTTGTPAANTNYPIAFDITAGDVPSLGLPATLDLNNPANFNFSNIQDNSATGKTKQLETKVDLTYTIDGFLNSIQVGGRVSRIKFDYITRQVVLGGFRVPASAFTEFASVYTPNDFLKTANPGLPFQYLAADKDILRSGYACTTLFPLLSPAQITAGGVQGAINGCTPGRPTPSGVFSVDEDNYAGYGKLNFGSQLSDSVKLSGNVGVRYVQTELASRGNLIRPNGTIAPNVFRRTDRDWLPNGVVRVDFGDQVTVRLGAAKVLSRPATLALNNGLTVSGVPAGNGGNPDLSPYKANQFDASFEWYFAPSAIASVGLFYKDVKTFIFTTVQPEAVPGFGTIPVTRQRNGNGGKIKGVEAQLQLPFTFLPAPFDGLGVLANYSYIDSSAPISGATNAAKTTIEGLSKNNVNIIGYYEKGPIGLRVAYNWRDKYFDSLGQNSRPIFFDSYADLSATAKVIVNDHLELEVQGANLLDEGLRRFNNTKEATASYALIGRTYTGTVRVKF